MPRWEKAESSRRFKLMRNGMTFEVDRRASSGVIYYDLRTGTLYMDNTVIATDVDIEMEGGAEIKASEKKEEHRKLMVFKKKKIEDDEKKA